MTRILVLLLLAPLPSAAQTAKKKGGPPIIALEAVPWDFELPRGFLVNRQLSRDFQRDQRPALTGEVHLRKHREDYEQHMRHFPKETVEPFDSSAWTITLKFLRLPEAQCVEDFLVDAEEAPGAGTSRTKLSIRGRPAYRLVIKSRVAEHHALILGTDGNACLIFDAPAVKLERAVWAESARAIDHIARTLSPRGDKASAVPWSKVPERYMFDGLEAGRKTLRRKSF